MITGVGEGTSANSVPRQHCSAGNRRSYRFIRLVIVALLGGSGLQPLVFAAPAHADPIAIVMAKTHRMSAPSLNSQQDGWYGKDDKLTLECFERGEPVKGYFSFNIPNGGWDNLWYRVSDNHFVANVDIETGTLDTVTGECGDQPPPPVQASSTTGRALGKTQPYNTGTPGQCTDGAMQKWHEATGDYPDVHGNAKDWADSASAAQWTVVGDAQPRSIVVFQPGVEGADPVNGHVAWVNSTSRRPDGLYINLTEMNNSQHGGPFHWWTRDAKDMPGMSYILAP